MSSMETAIVTNSFAVAMTVILVLLWSWLTIVGQAIKSSLLIGGTVRFVVTIIISDSVYAIRQGLTRYGIVRKRGTVIVPRMWFPRNGMGDYIEL